MNDTHADPAADFGGYFLSDTAAMPVKLPNGQPMLWQGQPVVVHVYGPSTEAYTAAKDDVDREAAARLMATIGNKPPVSAQVTRESDARFLAAVTARVENFPYPGGPLAIYREPRLRYIADQVRVFLGDLGNFFGASASS